MKKFDLVPIFLYKSSWEFNKKNCYDFSLELRLHLDKDLRESKGIISSGKA